MSECSARVTLAGLAAGTRFHYRVCLHKPSHGFLGTAGGCFCAGSFVTLPTIAAAAAAAGDTSGTGSDHCVSFVTVTAAATQAACADRSTDNTFADAMKLL